MSLPKFQYFGPESIEQVCYLLGKYGGEARLIAGGTDLLVTMKARKANPKYLIGLRNVPGLNYIRNEEAGELSIGAMTTIDSVARSLIVRQSLASLCEAAGGIGAVQIRTLATIGGNLCRAAPSSDLAPPLIALGAKVGIVGGRGKRTIDLEHFFVGPGKTSLRTDEVLVKVVIPNQPRRSGGAYLKLSRNSVDIALVGVASWIVLDDEGLCEQCKIVLGAVGPTPVLVREAEEMLRQERPRGALIDKVAVSASKAARPISDIRSSADYRRQMASVLTKRSLRKALKRASLIRGNEHG